VTESPPAPPTSAFVVRIWHEWSAHGSRWRGRIKHLQSGESAAFLDPDGMLDFICRFVAIRNSGNRSPRVEE
jgi:hypothetical protein